MTQSKTQMQKRRLGGEGLEVSALGLGCMGMSEFYVERYDVARTEAESIAVIHRALELGIDFLDTAEMYGPFTNERLVGRAIQDRPGGIVVAPKFGNQGGEDGSHPAVNGRPAHGRRAR